MFTPHDKIVVLNVISLPIRTIGIMVICSLFLAEVQVPLPRYSKNRGFIRQKLRIFKLFPVSHHIIIQHEFSNLANIFTLICSKFHLMKAQNIFCNKSINNERRFILSSFLVYFNLPALF